MREAVEERAGQPLRAKHRCPLVERQVLGDRDRMLIRRGTTFEQGEARKWTTHGSRRFASGSLCDLPAPREEQPGGPCRAVLADGRGRADGRGAEPTERPARAGHGSSGRRTHGTRRDATLPTGDPPALTGGERRRRTGSRAPDASLDGRAVNSYAELDGARRHAAIGGRQGAELRVNVIYADVQLGVDLCEDSNTTGTFSADRTGVVPDHSALARPSALAARQRSV